MEKIDIAEVINQMVRRACLFEKPKNTRSTTATATATTTITTTTTAYRSKVKNQGKANDEVFIEKGVDQVLAQPVVVKEAYPNLVSIIK